MLGFEFTNVFRDFKDIIDIFLVSFVLYKLIVLIRGTRAVQLLKGIIVIILATALSSYFELRAFNWLLDKTLTTFFFAIPVVFQPELRRALEQLGRGSFFVRSHHDEAVLQESIHDIVKAATSLSKNKIGGLIVIEGESGLNDFSESGTKLGADISSELLINLFIPNTPLHDGAVIIRKEKILAAACYLPLSENPFISKALGTRHRAGIGISEQSDAMSVIISEETGQISVADNGQLYKDLDEKALREKLTKHMASPKSKTPSWLRRLSKNG
ncbi:diadenylate cyclase CdaA [Desulfuribacillus alkaliarsenatis]|uniref:Diadenylate cyclase n=1 Tax=Desulfuribacillus alkaliarsenatis TaxID=766136 RepID=A0A1E5G3L5_9FIRM|nr:diadenylate cyclase CdaA [Desulfuribacillus alkaliarsenatis]OEF97665.1 TIGR00159 family protein [Desulfuribacillus alkaliarsenatis]